MTVLNDGALDALLVDLHEASELQIAAMMADDTKRQDEGVRPPAAGEVKTYLSDKLVALFWHSSLARHAARCRQTADEAKLA